MNDQEFEIINKETQKEKILNFFKKNLKKILISLIALIILVLGIISYQIFVKSNKERLSEKFNTAVINFESGNKKKFYLK